MRMVRLKLDKYLKMRDITRYKLSIDSNIRYSTVDKYYKNTVTRYDSFVLSKFCNALSCDISDLIECIED